MHHSVSNISTTIGITIAKTINVTHTFPVIPSSLLFDELLEETFELVELLVYADLVVVEEERLLCALGRTICPYSST